MRVLAIFGKVYSFPVAPHVRVVNVKGFLPVVIDHLRGIGSRAMVHHYLSYFRSILL